MVSDTGDAAQRIAGITTGIHLTDDRVFGPTHLRESRHRGPHAVAAVMPEHRLQRARGIRQAQFRCLGEQFAHIDEPAIIDGGCVQVNKVADREPVGDLEAHGVSPSRSAHADSMSRTSSMSVVAGSVGSASTIRSAPVAVSLAARSGLILST